MAAGIYNFTIEQGTTFIRVFKYKDSNGNPIDLSTATSLRMQIRESINSSIISEFTSASGQFIISSSVGTTEKDQFTLLISAATSSDYTFDRAVYDVELDSNGITTRLLQGKIKLSKEVTR